MSTQSLTKSWVDALAPRTIFQTMDVPGPRRAVETALSRLASDPASSISRIRQGFYWRKPPVTRFGTGRADPMTLAMSVAGSGAGPSGLSAANDLGLTTQVPAVPTVAVVGRAPKGLSRVHFVARSNVDRVLLTRIEVSVLEVLRSYPDYVEVPWPDVQKRVRSLIASGKVDPARLAKVAWSERSSDLQNRLASVIN